MLVIWERETKDAEAMARTLRGCWLSLWVDAPHWLTPAAGVGRNGRARAQRQARAVANALILRDSPGSYPFFILRSTLLTQHRVRHEKLSLSK